jgi:hypothetical protein
MCPELRRQPSAVAVVGRTESRLSSVDPRVTASVMTTFERRLEDCQAANRHRIWKELERFQERNERAPVFFRELQAKFVTFNRTWRYMKSLWNVILVQARRIEPFL